METVKVSYRYWRYDALSGNLRPYIKSNPAFEADEMGGLTVCTVVLKGTWFGTGVTVCDRRDRFVYKIGRELAYIRALEDAIRARTAELKRKTS